MPATTGSREGGGRSKKGASKKGRPRLDEIEQRHDLLLEAAARVFCREGFARTSIAKIAAESGASTKTLYARYANKTDLLVDLVTRLTRASLDEIDDVIDNADLPVAAVFEGVALKIARHWRSSLEVGLYRVVFAEAAHHPPLRRAFREVTAPFDDRMTAYIERLVAKGALPTDDPRALARQFHHLALGETLERALLGDPFSEQEMRRDIRRAVALMMASIDAMR